MSDDGQQLVAIQLNDKTIGASRLPPGMDPEEFENLLSITLAVAAQLVPDYAEEMLPAMLASMGLELLELPSIIATQ